MQKLPGEDNVAEEGEDEDVGLCAQGVNDGQGHGCQQDAQTFTTHVDQIDLVAQKNSVAMKIEVI